MSLDAFAIAAENPGPDPDMDREEDVELVEPPNNYDVRAVSQQALARLLSWCDPRRPVNIAAELPPEVLDRIGMVCSEGDDIDEQSRKEWLVETEKALDLALQKATPKSEPWPGASNVIYPLITQAATQFASRAYPAIVAGRNVVKSAVIGSDSGVVKLDPYGLPVIDPMTSEQVWAQKPGAKAERGVRISEHMSYQLLEEMDEWDDETDTLLNVLAVVGCEFRKSYWDFALGRPVSVRVPAKKVRINYWAKSIGTAPRIGEEIELYPYEIRERVASGTYLPGPYWEAATSNEDKETPVLFIEQHCRIDLDGDGYPEPYIVTFHKDSMKVARIVARFEVDGIKINEAERKIQKIKAIDYYTKYDFMPNIEGGIYGHGFARYLRNINEIINSTLNMIMDAGTQANMGGGFVGKGMSLSSGALRFRPGEYKIVNTPGQAIKDNIVPLRFDGPSQALLALLTLLIDAGKDIGAIKDVLTGELRAQTMSPTVFTALVEQGLKVFTGIYKRIHRSLKREFEKLYRLNRIYLPLEMHYHPQSGGSKLVLRDDYETGNGVEPYSDPTMVVEAQRMARAQVLEAFKDDPSMNGLEIRKRILEAGGIEAPEKILSGSPAPNPELILATGRLEIEGMVARAQTFKLLAEAIKAMAEADEKVTSPFMAYAQEQLALLQKNEPKNQNGQPGGSAGGNPAGEPAGVAVAPPPSGNAGDPALSPGLA